MENHESEKFKKLALRVYEKLPRNRAYALDESALEGLAAFCKAYGDAGGSLSNMPGDDGKTGEEIFAGVLLELGEYVPGLFQPKPDEAPTLPEWPRHPLTRELMPNPFAKETQSLAAQSKLMARDPVLAKAMKASVENPWQYFFDLEEEKQKREHVAAISYSADDHKNNPFTRADLTEQSEFVKRNDPVRAEIFKREAQPVLLFTPGSVNVTERGAMYRKAPQLFRCCETARSSVARWHDEKIAALKAAEEQARAYREQLEKQLQRAEAERPVGAHIA